MPTPSPDTKDRILDAAEALFAAHGFGPTSLRGITAAAGVNLAAVSYHFGGKEALFQAVFARRVDPVNKERLALLDALEARAGVKGPKLERVLEAFLRPALELARTPRGRVFMRLVGRIYAEPGEHWKPVVAQFEEVRERYLAALRRALPDLAPGDLLWRAHFMVGAMCHTLSDTHRLASLTCGLCDPEDVDGTLRQLVPFLAAGFRARAGTPVPGGAR